MNRNVSITVTGLALAAALGLAGCGGSASTSGSSSAAAGGASTAQAADAQSSSASPSASATPDTPTATELYPKMKAAVKAATSVKITGSAGSGSLRKIEFAGNRAGNNLAMTLTTDKGAAQIRIVEKVAYIKGDQKFWAASGAGSMASKFVGKWVKAPASGSSFKGASMDELLDSAFRKDPSASALKETKVDAVDLDGVKAYKISDLDTSSTGTIWVAAEGQPLPLRITSSKATTSTTSKPSASASPTTSSATTSADLRFSQWNAVPKVSAPPAAEIVSLPGQS